MITLSRDVMEINTHLCLIFYTEMQDGRQKWPGKQFLRKSVKRHCVYPAGKNFHQNRSILHHFQEKNKISDSKIQNGRHFWRDKIF